MTTLCVILEVLQRGERCAVERLAAGEAGLPRGIELDESNACSADADEYATLGEEPTCEEDETEEDRLKCHDFRKAL